MQILKLNDEVVTKLNEISRSEHLDINQLIEKLIRDYQENQKPVLMTDLMHDLPDIKAFEDNPVDIQRRMRDEWER